MNHQNLYWHLCNVIEITQSKDKSFFTLTDNARNNVVIYGDVDEQLFNAFVKIIPKWTHLRA